MISGLDGTIYTGKISQRARVHNNMGTRTTGNIVTIAINNLKGISKDKEEEPVEYVVKEETSPKAEIVEFKKEQKAEIVPLNRKNIENIKERASGGEER